MEKYSKINWYHNHRIERTGMKEIVLSTITGHTTIFQYSNPQECLEAFILLKKLRSKRFTNEW